MVDDTLKLLSEKTNQGKVAWTFQNQNTLQTTVGESLIYFREIVPDDTYWLSIQNKSGISLEDKNFSKNDPLFGEARDLFKSTYHQLLQPGKSIDSLNDTLRSL